MKRFIFLSIASSIIRATTINIPEDFTTIQEGINAAETGDTVLVGMGTYYENLILDKEIVLSSHALNDDLSENWLENENINGTIINGGQHPVGSSFGSCLIIRDNDINPLIHGFTFTEGSGTKMLTTDCEITSDYKRDERSGGGILIFKAYPTITYNKFINNGSSSTAGTQNEPIPVTNGGGISHFDDDDVEFDEDRGENIANQNQVRDIPIEMNIQHNYFEGNISGDGEDFYSHGYDGEINVSNSIFDNIDCDQNSVNEFVLRSKTDEAVYLQENISGNCIESNEYFVSAESGHDDNPGTEYEPMLTIRKVLSLVKESSEVTTIHVASGLYSPSTTGELFPITIPDNVHLIGAGWENTIIDIEANAQKQARGFIVQEVENVKIANFTIKGGSAEDAGCQGGGAILLTNNNSDVYDENGNNAPYAESMVILENLYITGNHAYNGGGVGIFRLVGPTLNNLIIEDNTAYIHGGGIWHHNAKSHIANSLVKDNEAQVGNGGGIMFAWSGGTLTDVTIENNNSGYCGGGMWANQSYELMLSGLSFVGNTATQNGGGWASHGSDAEFSDCLFENNTASVSIQDGNTFGGGAMWLVGSNPYIYDVTFSNNSSLLEGGGIYLLFDGMIPSSPTIENSLFNGNSVPQRGGGLLVGGSCQPVVKNTIFEYNEAGNGGAIQVDTYSGLTLTNSVVNNNNGTVYTGGIAVNSAMVTITNCTISDNTGGMEALDVYYSAFANVTNSIFHNNTPGDINLTDANPNSNVRYSNFTGDWEGDGNISADPLFVNAEEDDYRLQFESPCRDAGISDFNGDGQDEIIDYNGTAPDMGAYEFVFQAPSSFILYPQDSTVILTWENINVEGFQYYILERSTDETFLENLETFYSISNYYEDFDVDYGIEYFYRVYFLADDLSEYSETISVSLEFLHVGHDLDLDPAGYRMDQNFPNPFNPITKIDYNLKESGNVNVKVFDVLGKNVKTLVQDFQNLGQHSVYWDATNQAGEPVTAGMYFYTIESKNFKQTKKMILLK